jgi:AraC-like DNA-binding protein
MKNSIYIEDPLPSAMIGYANYAPFAPGRIAQYGKVQSRMLLWCHRGCGVISVNGEDFEIRKGSFIFLPWNHIICYKSDRHQPFMLAGIHIIPRFDPQTPFEYNVFHSERPDELQYRLRRDCYICGLEGVHHGSFTDTDQLWRLAVYIVEWFIGSKNKPPYISRSLASAVIYELHRHIYSKRAKSGDMPASLRKAKAYIDHKFASQIDVEQLADHCGCCRATLFRLFHRHLDTTPGEYMLARRIQAAKEMLSQTNLPVGRIAELSGITDRYYFSRLFRKKTGITPTGYRNANSLLPLPR